MLILFANNNNFSDILGITVDCLAGPLLITWNTYANQNLEVFIVSTNHYYLLTINLVLTTLANSMTSR